MIRRKVAFVVNETAHYVEFCKLLKNKKISSSIDPYILFDRQGFDIEKLFGPQIKDCLALQFNFTILNVPFIKRSIFISKWLRSDRLRFFPLRGLVICLLSGIENFVNQILFSKTHVRALKSYFYAHQIDKIILGEENVLLDTFVYAKAAEKRPVLVYPYTIPNILEMRGGAYKNYSENSLKTKFLKLFFNPWVKIFGDRAYLLLPLGKIVTLYFQKYFPKNPWILNADLAGIILMDSKKMKSLYSGYGVQEDQMKLVGSLNDDLLFNSLKRKSELQTQLIEKYGLTPDKPILLVAFPPSQFPRTNLEFSGYKEVIAFYAEALSLYRGEFNVLIAKHPRTEESLLALQTAGLTVADESTIELVSVCSLYVATVSATIRWALLAEVPVINYDLYQYDYNDYYGETLVQTVFKKQEFLKALAARTRALKLTKPQPHSINRTSEWGFLDGKVEERLAEILTQ